jgi:hypothetical protein
MITNAEYDALLTADWFDPGTWGKIVKDRLHL